MASVSSCSISALFLDRSSYLYHNYRILVLLSPRISHLDRFLFSFADFLFQFFIFRSKRFNNGNQFLQTTTLNHCRNDNLLTFSNRIIPFPDSSFIFGHTYCYEASGGKTYNMVTSCLRFYLSNKLWIQRT